LSVPTAELTAPARPARAQAPLAYPLRGLAGGWLYVGLAVIALVIAALSLLIPSTPSYDPWSWLVWGREIVHLKLHTTGGPTWKPLPVVFTTLFAPFGKAAPDMWLVIARAGALMAIAMVFKLATRLTHWLALRPTEADGARSARSLVPTLLAGVIAAGSVVVSRGFISDNALGYSEGLMTALVLVALDRHLDGARRQAFAVGFFAALDRPELWLAWGPYGLFLWWKDPGARKLVAALFLLIPVLWFLPEYWGSGHFFRGVNRAQHPRSNSPAFAKCPFCTELGKHAWPTLLVRVKIPAIIAMVVAALGLSRRYRWWSRRDIWWRRGLMSGADHARVVVLGAGAAGLLWWVLIAVLTQAGFSGNDRYLVLGAALLAVSGGVAWGWGAQALADLPGRLRRAAVFRRMGSAGALPGALAAAVAAAVFMAIPPWIGANVVDIPATHRALVYQAHLRQDMSKAVKQLGSARILRCGTVMTEGFQVPMLAWNLGVHTVRVEASPLPHAPLPPPPNVIFQTRAQRRSSLLPRVREWKGVRYHLAAHVRTFRVYSRCAGKLTL
jgi:hypothetical protein